MPVIAAIIAFLAAVTVSVISTYLAENFRRCKDAAALAAALAGELSAYAEWIPESRKTLQAMEHLISTGHKITTRDVDGKGTDPIFESSVPKIGLLGAELAGEVTYIYSGLRAFRGLQHSVLKFGQDMEQNEALPRIKRCLMLLNTNEARFLKLIVDLKGRAEAPCFKFRKTR